MNRTISKNIQWIIGIDEVGRGPIAGPLVMGAWACHRSMYRKFIQIHAKGVKDSKQLSEQSREAWFKILDQLIRRNTSKYSFHTVSISAQMIDKHGMGWALQKAVERLLKKTSVNPRVARVMLDGGLRAPKEYVFQETIIKGDQKEPIISAAAIMAKVSRDRYMKQLHKKLPQYGFDQHKGYGTKNHYAALSRYGASEAHRKTWL